MGRLRETLALFMALSPLQEAVIRATTNNGRLIELKHSLIIIDATFVAGQAQEVLYYLRPRLASKNWMSVWKSLTLLHLILGQGDSSAVLGAMQSELPTIQQMPQFLGGEIGGPILAVLAYAKYLTWRAAIGHERGQDLVRCAPSREAGEVGVVQLLADGTVDVLFSLLFHLSDIKFFMDDFDHPIMIQSAQLIFDDFVYIYGILTRLMIALLKRCQPVSPGSRDDLKLILSRFASVQASLEAFLDIFRKVEHLTDRRAPQLIPLPL